MKRFRYFIRAIICAIDLWITDTKSRLTGKENYNMDFRTAWETAKQIWLD